MKSGGGACRKKEAKNCRGESESAIHDEQNTKLGNAIIRDMKSIRVGLLIVSDRSSRGEREDACAPILAEAFKKREWSLAETAIVADDTDAIVRCLKDWCDRAEALNIVLTSGGTGLSPRDVTPESTRSVLDREVPGLAERMRREGEKSVASAVLSRAVCGTRKKTLILNLPGSPKGARESFECVADLLPHALHTMRGGDHSPAAEPV